MRRACREEPALDLRTAGRDHLRVEAAVEMKVREDPDALDPLEIGERFDGENLAKDLDREFSRLVADARLLRGPEALLIGRMRDPDRPIDDLLGEVDRVGVVFSIAAQKSSSPVSSASRISAELAMRRSGSSNSSRSSVSRSAVWRTT